MILLILVTSKSFAINISSLNTKAGVISLMYHRFNENKYPSTNIQNDVFLKHLDEIDKSKLEIITFKVLFRWNVDRISHFRFCQSTP